MYHYMRKTKGEKLRDFVVKNLISVVSELDKTKEPVYAVELFSNSYYGGGFFEKSSHYNIRLRTFNNLTKISLAHIQEINNLLAVNIPLTEVSPEYLFEKLKEYDNTWVNLGPSCKSQYHGSFASAIAYIFINSKNSFNLSEKTEEYFETIPQFLLNFTYHTEFSAESFRNVSSYDEISINRSEVIELEHNRPFNRTPIGRSIQIQGYLNLLESFKELEKTLTGKYRSRCRKEIDKCERLLKNLFGKTNLRQKFLIYLSTNIERLNKNINKSSKKLITLNEKYNTIEEKINNLPETDLLLIEVL